MTEIDKFTEAFIEAQKEMGNASKDSVNPFHKNRYADLNSIREACIPALNKHGIAVMQPIINLEGKNFVQTVLLHTSGQSMSSAVEIVYSKQNDAQAQGSGITYARRYGLQSLVCIGAEDDDGNASSKPQSSTPFGKLANIADEEEMQRLKSEKKQNDGEVKNKAAEEFFAKIKKDVEDCGSLSELQALEEENATKFKKLQTNYPDLHQRLLESIDSMKVLFIGE